MQENLEEEFEINIIKLARKFRVTMDALRPWCDAVMIKVKERIRRCWNNKYRGRKGVPVKSFSVLNATAAELHNNFIVSTVDKASNNFSIVCKKFYVTVLLQELGFNQDLQPVSNITYSPEIIGKEDVIVRHSQDLCKRFDIEIANEIKVLPKLF